MLFANAHRITKFAKNRIMRCAQGQEMFRGNHLYPFRGKNDYPRSNKKSDLGETILQGLFCSHRVKNLDLQAFMCIKQRFY